MLWMGTTSHTWNCFHCHYILYISLLRCMRPQHKTAIAVHIILRYHCIRGWSSLLHVAAFSSLNISWNRFVVVFSSFSCWNPALIIVAETHTAEHTHTHASVLHSNKARGSFSHISEQQSMLHFKVHRPFTRVKLLEKKWPCASDRICGTILGSWRSLKYLKWFRQPCHWSGRELSLDHLVPPASNCHTTCTLLASSSPGFRLPSSVGIPRPRSPPATRWTASGDALLSAHEVSNPWSTELDPLPQQLMFEDQIAASIHQAALLSHCSGRQIAGEIGRSKGSRSPWFKVGKSNPKQALWFELQTHRNCDCS